MKKCILVPSFFNFALHFFPWRRISNAFSTTIPSRRLFKGITTPSLVPRPTRKLKVGLVTRLEFCVPSKECGAGVGMQLEVV